MNFQFYLEKLFASEVFQKFMKENPSAYFCSGFIILDKEKGDNKIHIDYYNPETKKIFSFQLEGAVGMVPVEQIGENQKEGQIVLDKIADNLDFDFEGIEKMVVDKMDEQEVKSKIQKILLSLQKIEGGIFLVGTVFISGLGMIKIKVDLENKTIVEFEKKSFFDMMKIVKK